VEQRKHAVVIGGGVVGVCAAWYLLRDGFKVTLVDKEHVCAGCSHGNAGWIVPSYSVPMAAPGMMWKGLRWMLSPDSPFYIKPRLDAALCGWLLRFGLKCSKSHVRRSIPVLRDLSLESLKLFKELSALDNLDSGFRRDGLLRVYRTLRGFEAGVREAMLLKEFGIASSIFDTEGVHKYEPCLMPEVVGGILYECDGHLIPDQFVKGLAKIAEKNGLRTRNHTEVMGFLADGARIKVIETTHGTIEADEIVVATGAWSPEIGRMLGLSLPIQPAKGYSVTCMRPKKAPLLPISLGEAKVAVTPLGAHLRFGGTLELGGNDFSLNRVRINAIMSAAALYLRDVESLSVIETWRGMRPCTPDGLPIVGRSKKFENVILATGHGQLGVSLGPITGKLVAQLAAKKQPQINIDALSADRF
jgi:D-amino-acid dehydrogenase